MFLSIDFDSERPIYLQLKMQIIRGIASGSLQPGEKLPSIRSLAEELGINLHTVNKTYAQLKEAGYIVMDRRQGAVVNRSLPAVSREAIEASLLSIASEAVCGGMNREEFLALCTSVYERIR